MLKKIMELGVMIDPAAAEILKDERVSAAVFERLKAMSDRPLVLSAGEITSLCSAARLVKDFTNPSRYSMQDLIGLYTERYKTLQKMLLGKAELKNAVSIKNCRGAVAVIGAKRDGYIEDLSGRAKLITGAKLLDEDVVGVVGFASPEGIRAEKVLFPDVCLRSPATAPAKLVLGRDIPLSGSRLYDCCGVKILVHEADYGAIGNALGVAEKHAPLELLKRRHINNPPNDCLDEAPDIFLAVTKERFVQNYKGTTIIGCPKGCTLELDLMTRETKNA
ncbi:MAG: hypothetical protein QXU82_00420 [Candidatus Aenigmatarchaeota archaeon]